MPLSALLLLLNLQRVHPQGGHLASSRNDQNVVLSGRRALKILLGEGHTIHGSQSYYGVGTPAGLAKVGTGRRHADRNHTALSIYLPATQCQGPCQCLGHLESSWRQRPGPGPEACSPTMPCLPSLNKMCPKCLPCASHVAKTLSLPSQSLALVVTAFLGLSGMKTYERAYRKPQ